MSGQVMEKKAKVLIVEDEAPLRELLVAELSRSGYVVQAAANGTEGLTKYMEEIFNVVLLDVKMPDMSGVEV
jgi:CheY-like chemotaxis protein